MATIPSYPQATPGPEDLLLGINVTLDAGADSPKTRTFTVGSIVELASNGVAGPPGPPGSQGAEGIQGQRGLDGAVGPAGLNWRGTWAPITSYAEDDAVGWNGASWFCILATGGSEYPNLDTTHWALLASQGAQGFTGPQGPTGAQGSPGSITPIIASSPLTGGTITTTGTIGINQATSSVSGYLSSADWVIFNNKQDALGFTPYNATNPSAFISLTALSATSPILYNSTSGVISSQAATSSVNGYLTSSDWAVFNGKANVNSQTFTGTPSLPIGAVGVTQVAGTNNTTLATTEFVATAANSRLVVERTDGYTLTDADSGGIIIFKTTTAQTLTVPTNLIAGFECTFVTLAGVTLTVSAGSNVLNNAIGNLLPPQSSFTLKRMIAANTFIATGNL
jgi:hypothetical protein